MELERVKAEAVSREEGEDAGLEKGRERLDED